MLKPTQKQKDFFVWERGIFFHFGIRTFYEGHGDWDGRPMPKEAFAPDQLDCDAWIRTAKEGGMRYAILTTKHHDGFALWPSAYTDYSVKHVPWKDGKGDVVRAYVDACRKYGLKVGLYYSPAQWGGNIAFADERAYDDYFIAQISELLTGYGEIDYLWFDGCGSEKHQYDIDRIVGEIRRMQPGIMIFSLWDPDTRWCGNEDGYGHATYFYETEENATSVLETEKTVIAKRFLPMEFDFQMRNTWFYSSENEIAVKTPEELMGIYEMTVGRGGNFLINIGPDRHGLLPKADADALLAFEQKRSACYDTPLPFSEMVQKEDGDYVIETKDVYCGYWDIIKDTPLVNRILLREDLTDGQSVTSFRIYATLPKTHNHRVLVYEGTTIGNCRICTFPTVRCPRFTLEVTSAKGEVHIAQMTAHYHVSDTAAVEKIACL